MSGLASKKHLKTRLTVGGLQHFNFLPLQLQADG